MKTANEYLIMALRGYEERLKKEKAELNSMPEGSLIFMNDNGRTNYVQLIPASAKTGGKRIRRAINKDPNLIKQLARKKFLQKSVELTSEEVERIKIFLQSSRPPDAERVLETLPEKYKDISESVYFPKRAEAKQWAQKPFNQSTFNPEEKIHMSIGGIKVRTKSELLIADRLELYDLPFRYEDTLGYRQYSFNPDFSVMTTKGIMYWEHCGMMNDPKYRRRNEWKLQIYNKIGVVPWKNLIITYDFEDGGLDLRIIESEIVNKLLPFTE